MNTIKSEELTSDSNGNAIAIAKENEKINGSSSSFLVFKFKNFKDKYVFRVFTGVKINDINYYLDGYKKIVFDYNERLSSFHYKPKKDDILKELI